MLNNFCFHVYVQKSLSQLHTLSLSLSHSLIQSQSLLTRFHVYVQKSLFIAENCNAFFLTAAAATPSPVTLDEIKAGSQLKIRELGFF